MPPTIRFNRDAVLNAAYHLIRREGPHALNARSVAKELGGSTQPIFRLFSGMEELHNAVNGGGEKSPARTVSVSDKQDGQHGSGSDAAAVGQIHQLYKT